MKLFCKIVCVLAYGILFQIASRHANPIDQKSYSICQSRDCVRHANMIIKSMNPDVDPCSDFYSFACGGYKRKFGENETRSVYDDTLYLLHSEIKDLLGNLRPEEGNSSEKLKIVFDNCMNVESSERNSVSDAIDFLNHVGIPNWPYLNEDFNFVKLSDVMGALAAYDEFAFISFKPSPYDTKLADSNLHPPVLLLQGNFLLNSKRNSTDVYNSVIRTLNYFNVNKNETENIWKQFLEIETAGIRLQNEEQGNPVDCKSSSRTTHREVNCSSDTFGSMNFLCDLWKSTINAGDLDQSYSSDIIHIPCSWSHFHYLDNIFPYLDKISDKSLANYLSLRFFISHLDDLNSYFHLTKKTYPADRQSRTPEPLSRWEYCIGWIVKSMNSAVGYEYTRKILTQTTQNNVLNIIDDYVQQLNASINDITWLGDRIKLYLQKQLGNLEIGFRKTMENYRNKTIVESLYKKFYPEKGSFLKNILDYQKMALFTKEKPSFNSFSSSSDPYTMDFGVTLLQPPTFAYNLPKIWNYAALGSVIGHELSHNLKFFFDFVHLDEETENYLNNKMQCFVQQYSQFLKNGKTIDSSEAKEEIIADNIGWELTEKIIHKMINANNNELMKLPGLDFTPLQLAYISFAQDSCAVLSKSVEDEFYASKPQNLLNLRILGVLQNSKTFSETFDCAKGDKMNPEYKCTFFEQFSTK